MIDKLACLIINLNLGLVIEKSFYKHFKTFKDFKELPIATRYTLQLMLIQMFEQNIRF